MEISTALWLGALKGPREGRGGCGLKIAISHGDINCLLLWLGAFKGPRGGEGRGERERFFSFFSTSQCVHTMFLSSSQWVFNIFSISPHFYMP